ncbi:4'-phosphopantetheinyl transferase family protein [Paracandidimonas soli]|uniref:4'-phosphopantetheinyl transferase n=1 Tax=Paracandidimonas soli TaxID=1917182 RepID=A0A4R3V1R8_9BURK|nr:4'-phosphopantetheinyl transferase superfamily protein [Paracandidimonas soli]TCU97128.1 4'-phosphopantetheinyl transferase [Paracandidimonas soli]
MIELTLLRTDVSDGVADGCLADLTQDERNAFAGMRREADRRSRVVTRAVLRRTLGRKLGCGPADVPLSHLPGGKPVLDEEGGRAWHFNVSHSGNIALLAVADNPVGVDVETRMHGDPVAMARQFFCAQEQERVAGARDAGEAFLAIWTAKEAVVKMTGHGLRIDPRRFCVPHADTAFQPLPPPYPVAEWQDCRVASPSLADCSMAVSVMGAPIQELRVEHYEH